MTIICGDCLEVMKTYPDNHFSSVVTDPPYGLSFMGKGWDHAVPGTEYWKECLRVTKPGGFILAMGGTRTYHRLTCAIEDAGWEIRDSISWIYGQGFPKSHNNFGLEGYGTALKPAMELVCIAMKPLDGTFKQNAEKWGQAGINISDCRINTLTSQRLLDIISENEVIWEQEKCLCNSCVNLVTNKTKPEILEITESFATNNAERILIENARKFLTDINMGDIGCSAIPSQEEQKKEVNEDLSLSMLKSGKNLMGLSLPDLLSIILITIHSTIGLKTCNLCRKEITHAITSQNTIALKKETLNMLKGHVKKENGSRWPSNLILDEEAGALLDEQSGDCKTGNLKPYKRSTDGGYKGNFPDNTQTRIGSSGGASRFFYCAKASSRERNEGLDELPDKKCHRYGEKAQGPLPQQTPSKGVIEKNNHPTVKPLSLMRYLITLISPPTNALILDPFCGSGTTILAAKQLGIEACGIEREETYCEIAKKRIENFSPIEETLDLFSGGISESIQ